MAGFNLQLKRPGKIRSITALDIGSHSIKMIEISVGAERPSLVSFGIKKIQGLSSGSVADAVRTLSEDLKIAGRDLNISLAGSSIVARVISMPDMGDEDLKNAIRFETEKFIPFDINECTLDFHIQGKSAREKNNLDILLAAAKKDYVLAKIKIVEDAGFSVNVVDVDSFALTNAFLKNFTSIEPAKTIALINVGAVYTNLVILRGGVISFVRDLAIGVNDFCQTISKKCGVNLELSDWSKGVSAEKSAEVALSAKSALAGLVDEIKLSFGYHENQSGRGIDEIHISGGGAGFIGLEEAFNDTFGSKPARWNPFQFLNIDPSIVNADEIAGTNGSFAVCAGLALRGGL
ncbi:MAG: type IV pilus assembly protein PilM [Candidatus Omnitrophica bacterium]|nr:type IV pilus assembly protein PilM [Candidatus Omnitrophota bacterium]